MADIRVTEVLCFIPNRFFRMNKIQQKVVLTTFCREEKLSDVKVLLFADAGKLNVEGLWNADGETTG